MNLRGASKEIKNKFLGNKNNAKKTYNKVSVKNRKISKEEMKKLVRVGKFNESFVAGPAAELVANHFNSLNNILLNTKVDDYIKWNYKNIIEGNCGEYGEYLVLQELRNLIEKMAVWYELRYPDYEINRKMCCCGQEEISINNIMFNDNKYINELFDDNSDIRALDWDEFFNTSVFFNSLPWKEKCRFERAKYPYIVGVDSSKISHLYLTSDGFIEGAKSIDVLSNNKLSNEQLNGMHVTEVINLLKQNGIELPENNELEKCIKRVENRKKEKEGLLDAVMYRIIERGGNRIGPRRAFLFAKEFGRNIDIPMMYAIDRSDPGLRLFINEYIKSGGSKDLICYVDYFYKILVDKEVKTISIQDLILTQNNNAVTFYTPEETKLHQRLVNTLFSQVNPEEVKKEQVKQLRLQRKLERSKNDK